MIVKKNEQKHVKADFFAGDQIRVNQEGHDCYFMICQDIHHRCLLVTLGADDHNGWYDSGNLTSGDGTIAYLTEATTISELIDDLKQHYGEVEKVHLNLIEE